MNFKAYFKSLIVLNAALLPVLGLPETFSVTNSHDSGQGSLRAAMDSANAAGGSNEIVFSRGATGTIVLSSFLPPIQNNLTINPKLIWSE